MLIRWLAFESTFIMYAGVLCIANAHAGCAWNSHSNHHKLHYIRTCMCMRLRLRTVAREREGACEGSFLLEFTFVES